MKSFIKIKTDTSVKGVPAFKDDIIEIDASDANILVRYGLAAYYVPETTEAIKPTKEVERPFKKRRI